MGNDSSDGIRNQPPPTPHRFIAPDHGGEPRLPDLTTSLRYADHILDRFANHSPNEVLRGMGSLITLRPGRLAEMGAMREGAGSPSGSTEGARRDTPEGMHVMRHGRMILVGEGASADEARRGEGASEARRASDTVGRLSTQSHGTITISTEELNLFEKIFLAHFQGNIPLGDALAKGQFKFLPKSEQAWMEFFKTFLAFTMLKEGNVGDVQSLIFRGLMTPQGTLTPEAKTLLAQAKAVLVSDLKFENGATDKFARLAVMSEPMLHALSKMAPGDVMSHELLAQLASQMPSAAGEGFSYLSLSHKVVNPDMIQAAPSAIAEAYQSPEKMKEKAIREGVREVTSGIALSAKTEQMIAERLDINLRPTQADVIAPGRPGAEKAGVASTGLGGLFGKKKKKGGFWGAGAEEGDGSPIFVPWYQHVFGRQKFKGKPRWWVPLLYFVATSAAAFGLIYVFRYWMH